MQAKVITVLLSALIFKTSLFAGEAAINHVSDSGYAVVRVKMEGAAGCTMQFSPALSEEHTTTHEGYIVYKCRIPRNERYSFIIKDPNFKISPKDGLIPCPQLQILLKKGATLTIEGNAKSPIVSRITSTDRDIKEYEIYRSRAALIENELWQAGGRLMKLEAQQDTSGALEMKKQQEEILQRRKDWEREFVKTYPNGMAALEIFNLFYRRLEDQDAWEIFRHYPDSLKADGTGREIAQFFDALHRTQAGNAVITFRQQGIDGKIVDVGSMRGKIVVIDFWGTWCSPCRKSHPHLRAIYDKYHDRGLEMIGIADEGSITGITDSLWRKAVKEDGMTWLQILNDPDRTDLVKQYSVTSFPTKLIIDREGKIVFRVSDGASPEFDQKLEELLK